MADNLLNQMMKLFSGDTVSKISSFIGGDATSTQTAITSSLPLILGGLINKTSNPSGASSVFDMLKGADTSMLNNFGSMVGGGSSTDKMLSTGNNFLGSVFGNKVCNVTDSISGSSGLSSSSSGTLLGILGSIVMSFLGKYISSNGISNAGGLTSLLSGQAGFLKGLIPASLLSSLGLGNLFSGSSGKVDETVTKLKSTPEETKSGMSKILLPLIALAALIALIYFFSKGCNKDTVTTSMKDTVRKTIPQTTPPKTDSVKMPTEWAKLGKFNAVKLLDGTSINIPELGVENKLIGFIQDKTKLVDKDTWFTFDRILFETGKSTLTTESMDQIKNMGAIMKAFPNVELKIGGYTDNTGNAATNKKLSQDRANTVMNEIVKLGIAPARLKAEGYGPEFPVADNSTDEGRQKNRRIDVRVSKK